MSIIPAQSDRDRRGSSAVFSDTVLTGSQPAPENARLIVVSNRVATRLTGNSGGLAVALKEATAASGGLWFGWSGRLDAEAPKEPARIERDGRLQRATIDLTPEEHEGYYRGFANGCLWPALHYRLDLMRHSDADRDTYMRVNARFAAALDPLIKPHDLIWVHDFHLIPLGQELRRRGQTGPIGFFLHTPLPSPEIFASIPGHRRLARALMAYDVIGFQTHGDQRNFITYLERYAAGRLCGEENVEAFGRRAATAAIPVGINLANVEKAATMDCRELDAQHLRGGGSDLRALSQLIIGVDRLDYTKGIPERLAAFERLLQRAPEYRGKAALLQIAPPTREGIAAYDELTQEVQRIVGGINGRFGTLDWTPVTFINRPLPRETLLGLLRRARVGLVTPLRDGMNLVAKEYVAAQDETDPGVLLLSQFAGAAEELNAAMIVNPHDIDAVAEALAEALAMPLAQRQVRHRRLYMQVAAGDVARWRSNFLQLLSARGNISEGSTSVLVGAA